MSDAPTPSSAFPNIDRDTIEQVERIVGVRFSEPERRQLLRALPDIGRLLRARKSVPLPNSLPPAVYFRPEAAGPGNDPRSAGASPRRYTKAGNSRDGAASSRDQEDIAFLSARVLAGLVRSGEVSSVELTRIYLDRLERFDGRLNCVAELTAERALEEARLADEAVGLRRATGALHGVPWGAKDLFDTAGIGTRWGAEPFAGGAGGYDRVPDRDAAVVERLSSSGAVLAAKLSLGALAYNDVWYRGRTNSPWNPLEGSSGSSAGSAAAVASGLVGFALGTETMGSIISPSLRCGTAGLRPTYGRVPRTGAMSLCWTFDKVGPICRTVNDCFDVLEVIAGSDGQDPDAVDRPLLRREESQVRGLRVGYDPRWFEDEETSVVERQAVELLASEGFVMRELSFPELPYEALSLLVYVEAAAAFEGLTDSGLDDTLRWQDDDAWPSLFRTARLVPAVDYVQLQRFRSYLCTMMNRIFGEVDLLLSPGTVGPLLYATNGTGHPSLTLRTGFVDVSSPETGNSLKVPRGVNLFGGLWDEGTLCAAGTILERASGVWKFRPPI